MAAIGVDQSKINLFSFTGKMKILHMSWLAFFISFMVWFNFAPLMASIRDTFGLSDQEVKLLLILNVALTIPARIIIGMLVDKYGPKITFSALLAAGSFVCFLFAFARSYEELATYRFLLGFIGAGFVIGIRLVSEWFPAKQVGTAEGIYGGWGNFGSAGAAIALPTIALWIGGDDGWRWAVATTGVLALLFSVIFYFSVSNNPKGTTYFRPKNLGAMEVSNKLDFYLYILMTAPLYIALAVLAWKIGPANLDIFSALETSIIYLALSVLYVYQVLQIWRINKALFAVNAKPVAQIHRYKFKQVVVLNLSYMITFGAELAVISFLPLFFFDTFKESANLSMTQAALIASIFAGLNLIMRPAGGIFSDKFGRKKTLLITLAGSAIGFMLMGQINADWSIAAAVAVMIVASVFVNAGNGAVFAVVPLVKRRLTGQVAGTTGAFGNVGGVTFLTVLSFVDSQVFFITIGCAAVFVWLIALFVFEEPKGFMYEENDDGTIEKIELH
ncbi:NarK family nitrate/nitrite MFS transporter [Mariprofundus ferrooxydans]|nr:NarK family nitrate/nitrite MFS transporter [Mariprofundus ferrooxydans]MBN4076807.1 NarK family nitrate/nitrite MFS transporter [Mariprofundus ferrooxydans]